MFNYADLRSYLNYAEPEVTNAAQPGSTFVDDVISQQAPRLAQDTLGLQSAQPWTVPEGVDLSGLNSPNLPSYNPTPTAQEGENLEQYISRERGNVLENQQNNYSFGEVQNITAGGDISSAGQLDIAPEKQTQFLDTYNQQMDDYYAGVTGKGEFVAPPDPNRLVEEITGIPAEFTSSDGTRNEFNAATGKWTGAVSAGDDWFTSLVKKTPALMGAFTGAPLLAAGGGGLSSATQGGDFEDIVTDSLVAGAGSYVGGQLGGPVGEIPMGERGTDFALGLAKDAAFSRGAFEENNPGAFEDETYDPSVEDPDIPMMGDFQGPGGFFDLSILDYPAGGSPQPEPAPVSKQEDQAPSSGGGGGAQARREAQAQARREA